MRDWLIEIRHKTNMTQLTVSERAGISRAYYTQIELGRRTPSIRTAKTLARILGFTWSRFYDD